MFVDATIDVGCGTFSWSVEKPSEPESEPAKPTVSSRECHDAHNHYDVHADWVDAWSSLHCKPNSGKMKAGDKEIYWHPLGGDYHQNYKISWIEGCTVATEQNVTFPIEGDEGVTCANLLRDNYYRCKSTTLEYIQARYDLLLIVLDQTGINGGAGGSIDAGCLRYDFYVT
jgi:hypothetical protein